LVDNICYPFSEVPSEKKLISNAIYSKEDFLCQQLRRYAKSQGLSARLLGKLEYFNPTGSV
jgi:cysteine synthase